MNRGREERPRRKARLEPATPWFVALSEAFATVRKPA